MPKAAHRRMHGKWKGQEEFNSAQKLWYGTPHWAKLGAGAPLSGGMADIMAGDCEC